MLSLARLALREWKLGATVEGVAGRKAAYGGMRVKGGKGAGWELRQCAKYAILGRASDIDRASAQDGPGDWSGDSRWKERGDYEHGQGSGLHPTTGSGHERQGVRRLVGQAPATGSGTG